MDVIITLNPGDVATLREVFSLATVQSEAILDDLDPTSDAAIALAWHNQLCRLMARIDAMLPDSTGFFD